MRGHEVKVSSIANKNVRPTLITRPSSMVPEDLVYNYALRIAYLAYLTEPKIPKAPKTAPSPPVSMNGAITRTASDNFSKRHTPSTSTSKDKLRADPLLDPGV